MPRLSQRQWRFEAALEMERRRQERWRRTSTYGSWNLMELSVELRLDVDEEQGLTQSASTRGAPRKEQVVQFAFGLQIGLHGICYRKRRP